LSLFFGSEYFSGYAAIASELFPTEMGATVMGAIYDGEEVFRPWRRSPSVSWRRGTASGRRFCCWRAHSLAAALPSLALSKPEQGGWSGVQV
jgi:hypothetical protein